MTARAFLRFPLPFKTVFAALIAATLIAHPGTSFAQSDPPPNTGNYPSPPVTATPQYDTGTAPSQSENFSSDEIIQAGHEFFGEASQNIALAIEQAFERYGQPNGYVLGEEASAAFIGGLRYGEGTLYTRNAGNHPVFWQGPSIGFDWGGDGARTMVLVYQLDSPDSIYKRFGGVSGSAFIIGGVGFTALTNGRQTIIPVRSGIGARFGANAGYLKFSRQPTWNPF